MWLQCKKTASAYTSLFEEHLGGDWSMEGRSLKDRGSKNSLFSYKKKHKKPFRKILLFFGKTQNSHIFSNRCRFVFTPPPPSFSETKKLFINFTIFSPLRLRVPVSCFIFFFAHGNIFVRGGGALHVQKYCYVSHDLLKLWFSFCLYFGFE